MHPKGNHGVAPHGPRHNASCLPRGRKEPSRALLTPAHPPHTVTSGYIIPHPQAPGRQGPCLPPTYTMLAHGGHAERLHEGTGREEGLLQVVPKEQPLACVHPHSPGWIRPCLTRMTCMKTEHSTAIQHGKAPRTQCEKPRHQVTGVAAQAASVPGTKRAPSPRPSIREAETTNEPALVHSACRPLLRLSRQSVQAGVREDSQSGMWAGRPAGTGDLTELFSHKDGGAGAQSTAGSRGHTVHGSCQTGDRSQGHRSG